MGFWSGGEGLPAAESREPSASRAPRASSSPEHVTSRILCRIAASVLTRRSPSPFGSQPLQRLHHVLQHQEARCEGAFSRLRTSDGFVRFALGPGLSVDALFATTRPPPASSHGSRTVARGKTTLRHPLTVSPSSPTYLLGLFSSLLFPLSSLPLALSALGCSGSLSLLVTFTLVPHAPAHRPSLPPLCAAVLQPGAPPRLGDRELRRADAHHPGDHINPKCPLALEP
jgi:hypothetical protein